MQNIKFPNELTDYLLNELHKETDKEAIKRIKKLIKAEEDATKDN